MYICVCMLCEFRGPQGQKKASDALSPELRVVVSCLTLVLQTELNPSRKAVRVFNCSVIFSTAQFIHLSTKETLLMST